MDAAELLNGPADEGGRRVALALLDAAIAARTRLDDPEDMEALHDFRVALRKLRSWLRAFRAELGVRPKHRRRLRAVSRAAGAARDAQVHVAWLRDAEETLQARERVGGEWLLRRAVDQQRTAGTAFNAATAATFLPTANALANDLAVYTLRIDLRDPTPRRRFAEVAAPLILADAAALGERLAAVQSSQDQALAHAARIAGKRLRYLLEPIADAVEGADSLVRRLRNLQDTIGEMHDVHVMAADVIQAAETSGAEQARRVTTALLESDAGDEDARMQQARDPRLGLLAVAAQLRARGESAFTDLRQHWLGDHVQDLVIEAREVAVRMLGISRDQPTPKPSLAGKTHQADLPAAATASPPVADVETTDLADLVRPTRMPPADSSNQAALDSGRRRVADIPVAIMPSADHTNGTGDGADRA